MSSETFHVTKEDIRKLESKESKKHGGDVPADSEASALKSIIDSKKGDPSNETAKLPLPEQPPVAGDMKSADVRYQDGIGSGRFSGKIGTEEDAKREPVAQESAVRADGEFLHKGAVV